MNLQIAPALQPPADDPHVIAQMAPADYLRLASVCLGAEPWDASQIPAWDEWPYLWVDPDTATVHGHEGAHRVTAMQMAGINLVDIIIFPVPTGERATLDWTWNGQMPAMDTLRSEGEWRASAGIAGA